MLPAVMPLVSVLWKRMKKMMQGKMPSKAAELCRVMVTLCSARARAIASGTVCFAFEIRKINGVKRSFHVHMKKNTNSTESVGIVIGTIILNNRFSLLQPSITAASINSLGNALNAEVNKYVPKEA